VKRALTGVRSEIEEVQMLVSCSSYETLLETAAELINLSDYERLKDGCGVREDLWGTTGEYWITEGWCLSESFEYGLQIQKFDDDPRERFSCDADAVAYVTWRASIGSDFHAEVPAGWHTYFYVFTGKIALGAESFHEGETGLITSSARMFIDADKESIVVAFVLNPNAKLVRLGTVGR
jgi:hypothetical protein